MTNITQLPTITTVSNASTFVVIDNRLTKRINYQNLKSQISTDLVASGFKGEKGDKGNTGTNGINGSDGVGIPLGGVAGQVISKTNSGNYNVNWLTLATVSTTGNYSSLIGTPSAYSATSINALSDVDTSTNPPSDGQALVWSASSSTWIPGASGGGSGVGLSSRTSAVASTGIVISSGATGYCQTTGFKSYLLSKVTTTNPAWVRIYTDITSRTNDASRAEGNDPLPGAGIIAEVITTSGALTQLITPGVIGFNNDTITTSTIYLTVTNKDAIGAIISVTLNILQLET